MGYRIGDLIAADTPIASDVKIEVEQDGKSRQASLADLPMSDAGQAYIDLLSSPSGASEIGAGIRTQASNNADIISVRDYIATAIDGTTDNQAGIVSAVAAALAVGGLLYWPAGTYVSSATIPNFHNVSHFGNGVVKRGADTFKIAQRSTQTNKIYIATTGSSTNDGLSASQPIDTLQNGVNVLNNYGPILPGIWIIQLAAGTYGGLCTFPENVRGKERVQINGPAVGHPNVPTAILDGSGTQSFGFNCNANNKLLVQNILTQNFTDYGLVFADFCDVYTINVHSYSNSGGQGMGFKFQQGRLRMEGGIIKDNTYNIVCLSQVTISIGTSAGSLANGPQILNAAISNLLLQENTTGHVDYATITGAVYGLDIVQESRVNSSGCLITGASDCGVRTRMQSAWLDGGTNTLSGNATDIKNFSYSGETNTINQLPTQVRTICDVVRATLTGTTANTAIKTYAAAIKKNTFDWIGRSLKVTITGQFTGGASTKTVYVYVGGNLMMGLTSINSSTGFFKFEGMVHAITSTSQDYNVFMLDTTAQNAPVSPCKGDSGTRAYNLNTGADLTITVQGQLGNAADSIVIHSVEMWQTGA